MIIEAGTAFGSPIFREIVITGCWTIWTARNGLIFYSKPCNINSWKIRFKEEIGLVCIKAKPNLAGSLNMYLRIYISFSFAFLFELASSFFAHLVHL
jgi:hypothetical protein